MNCQKFESLASELARGEMMDVGVLGDAQAHQAECSSCSARLRDEEMLTRGLHSLALEMNSLQASPSVEERLLVSFREPQVVVPLTTARSYRPYWLTAVAAILLVVVGLVAIIWRNSNKPKNELAVRPPVPQLIKEKEANNETAPKPDNAINLPKQPKPKRILNPRELQAKNSKANRAESPIANHASEVATDFMLLGYLNPASLQDGGQIVRVEVPRTTMASFGFPVNMDRYNERVKADVLLGVDGVPHAIRFVQDKRSQ